MHKGGTLKVVYSSQMVGDPLRTFPPTARKPMSMAAALTATDWPLELVAPEPASVEDLERVHDSRFVVDILSLRRTNGFGSISDSLARSLPYQSGAFHTGSLIALSEGLSASLSSGFHHAHHDRTRAFCTFNGLMVSALKLFESGRVRRLAIIDCDFHYGDGTQALIDRFGVAEQILHVSFGHRFRRAEQARSYLDEMDRLQGRLADFAPDLIFYQAGADTHIDDPLGGLLTTEQMRQRDRTMFETALALGVPLTWNLAGGYQSEPDGSIPRVIELHVNTFAEALDVYGFAPAMRQGSTHRRVGASGTV